MQEQGEKIVELQEEVKCLQSTVQKLEATMSAMSKHMGDMDAKMRQLHKKQATPFPPAVTNSSSHQGASHLTPIRRPLAVVSNTTSPKVHDPPADKPQEAGECGSPAPVSNKGKLKELSRLPSSAIKKGKLISVDAALLKYVKLAGKESSAGSFACKLAREAFFGLEVMEQCTCNGHADRPGLPKQELMELKETVRQQFPKYWSTHEFEVVWVKCQEALSQSCKRLRSTK